MTWNWALRALGRKHGHFINAIPSPDLYILATSQKISLMAHINQLDAVRLREK